MAEQYIQEFERDPGDVGDSQNDGRPEMSEYDLHAELLLELLNEIKVMRYENMGIASGKPGPKPRFRKGPLTAYETVRQRLEHAQHDLLVATLTPRDENGRRVGPHQTGPHLGS